MLLLLVISQGAFADKYPFLKVDNPNELQVGVFSNNDTLTSTELQEIVNQVVRRSRIKPVEATDIENIFLSVTVNGDPFKISQSNIYFAEAVFSVDTKEYGIVKTPAESYVYGKSNKSGVIQAVKSSVEKVIDMYLQENFDL